MLCAKKKLRIIERLVGDDHLEGYNLDHKVLVDDVSQRTVRLEQVEIQREMEVVKLQMQEQGRKDKKIGKSAQTARVRGKASNGKGKSFLEERIKLT